MEERQKRGNLVFAVNGERFELPSVDPSTTLLHFLRSETCYKSPKLGCGEGNDLLFFHHSVTCINMFFFLKNRGVQACLYVSTSLKGSLFISHHPTNTTLGNSVYQGLDK